MAYAYFMDNSEKYLNYSSLCIVCATEKIVCTGQRNIKQEEDKMKHPCINILILLICQEVKGMFINNISHIGVEGGSEKVILADRRVEQTLVG